jgi:uncharacterized protein (DUF2342 family)
VDWDLALANAYRMRRRVPTSPGEAAETVADLRRTAVRVRAAIPGYTGLPYTGAEAEVVVTDQEGTLRRHVDTFRTLFSAVSTPREHSQAARTRRAVAITPLLASFGRRSLGNYDLYGAHPVLVLNAPAIVASERQIHAVRAHYRAWVCLHEEVHRAQHAAAPWLPAAILGRLAVAVKSLHEDPKAFRASPGVRDLTAIHTVLEGYAEMVVALASPELVPTRDYIKAARAHPSLPQWAQPGPLVTRLLGMGPKVEQYGRGEAFCRRVVSEAGMDVMNRVWECAELMPTQVELEQPDLWLERAA